MSEVILESQPKPRTSSATTNSTNTVVPGSSDGSLDFGAIVKRFAGYGYEGWFVVEAEQDPRKAPPQKMAEIGHAELMRVMTAAGYTVETEGFPKG